MKIENARKWLEVIAAAIDLAEAAGVDEVNLAHPALDAARDFADEAGDELRAAIAEAEAKLAE